MGKKLYWMGNMDGEPLIALAGLTHFLMEHLVQSGNQKKKTHFVVPFFLTGTGLRPLLTGLQPVLPIGQCSPMASKSVALKLNAIAPKMLAQKSCMLKHTTTHNATCNN